MSCGKATHGRLCWQSHELYEGFWVWRVSGKRYAGATSRYWSMVALFEAQKCAQGPIASMGLMGRSGGTIAPYALSLA
jgi:hypothetical protein